MSKLVISAIGVTSAVGQGKTAFLRGLLNGKQAFGVMQRKGRQQGKSQYLGAEIGALAFLDKVSPRLARAVPFPTQVALQTLAELIEEAKLEKIAKDRIGCIIGGSNFNQRELQVQRDKYRERMRYLRPTYGLSFLDTDMLGACTQQFPVTGLAHTIGGASASGLVAVLEAAEAVRSGRVDHCIAIGAMMDLSYWECAGFRALGAMGSDRFANEPERACRPFDETRDGFIFGEACAALLIEKQASALIRGVAPYAQLAGWATTMDGNRNPDPSLEGETQVIKSALREAGIRAADVGYVNPHGSGSQLGDLTELEALKQCGLEHTAINTTKSITGHSLTAAGAVEVAAVCLQLREHVLHPCLNLEKPISAKFDWVQSQRPFRGSYALKLSMGFGGINAALCMRECS